MRSEFQNAVPYLGSSFSPTKDLLHSAVPLKARLSRGQGPRRLRRGGTRTLVNHMRKSSPLYITGFSK